LPQRLAQNRNPVIVNYQELSRIQVLHNIAMCTQSEI
jgi:hypothetical protein